MALILETLKLIAAFVILGITIFLGILSAITILLLLPFVAAGFLIAALISTLWDIIK